MAEAFGVAAGVIAVVQVTKSILAICNESKNALRDALWELPRIKKEMEDLLSVLQPLEQLAKSAEPCNSAQLPNLSLLCGRDGLLEACLNEIKRLEEKLKSDSTKKSGLKRKALVQSLRKPSKEDETDIALETISRYKATLHLALTADQTYASVLSKILH
jgi:hypothetical protein